MRFRAGLAGLCGLVASGLAPAAGYLDTLPVFWSEVYPEGGETLYCGTRFERYDRRVNVEHVFPMSWATKELGCGDRDRCRLTSDRFNRIESDMHNMFPALKEINEARGAYAFGLLKGERHLVRGCDFELNHRDRRVEPRPQVRGDIARAMLYMSDRYDLKLYERQRRMLEDWDRLDPPDAEERRRNAVIGRIQGNPNPLIDR